MEAVNYVALSIPVFFFLIGVELVVARWRGERLYRLNDTVNDLSCGILQQVLGVFTKAVVIGAYAALYAAGHLLEIPLGSVAAWVVCFVGVDFFYYWFHRVSHESNLPWGAHVVHHQSEEFNLAVALRQGALQPLFSWVFYLPLALLGFPPAMFLVTVSFNTLYQFWIHTRLIGKLGPLEWVLNTPSHHRVHHGRDDKYLDKNYAGVFIVWDRFFGTFQEEEEEPTYGITKPLASWNPLWANVHVYADLVRAGRAAPSLGERLRLWWIAPAKKPAWAAAVLGASTPGGYDARAPRKLAVYALAQLVSAVAMTLALLFADEQVALVWRLLLAGMIAWTLTNLGAAFERRGWLARSELSRLGVLAVLGAAAVLAGGGPWAVPAALAAWGWSVVSLVWWWLSREPAAGAGESL